MRLLLPLLCLFCLAYPVQETFAQSLRNIKAQTDGDKVVITYDLEAPDSQQKFQVELFSSHDNYRNPLKYLSGEYGNNVVPGKNKRIEWDAKSEIRTFTGNITFEVRATAILPAISFVSPTAGAKLKKGKSYTITWEGSGARPGYKLQLYTHGVVSQTIGQVGNEKRITWIVPEGLQPGKGYSIKMVDGTSELASSKEFAIAKKMPVWLKIAPVVAAGAVVYLLLGNSPDDIDPLPGPPGPPNE